MGKKRPFFITLLLPCKSLKSCLRPTTPREASTGSTGSDSGDRQGRKGRGEEKKAPQQQQQGDAGKQRKQAGRGCRKPQRSYPLGTDNDIVGIVMLKIASAEDLPQHRSDAHVLQHGFIRGDLGWGQGLPHKGHPTLNPIWEEKLLSMCGSMRLGKNKVAFNVSELIADTPQPLPLVHHSKAKVGVAQQQQLRCHCLPFGEIPGLNDNDDEDAAVDPLSSPLHAHSPAKTPKTPIQTEASLLFGRE
ncbi:hypothetical protein K438DRAFT_1785332 [Mycena galopus ATCC 62051]|nr:hypothetical protein K438DRAFT_1785332 [Mycena galopus ATCC 62051]